MATSFPLDTIESKAMSSGAGRMEIGDANKVVKEDGQTYIKASQRADGSWRKERKVKQGYTPQDEVAVFASPSPPLTPASPNGSPSDTRAEGGPPASAARRPPTQSASAPRRLPSSPAPRRSPRRSPPSRARAGARRRRRRCGRGAASPSRPTRSSAHSSPSPPKPFAHLDRPSNFTLTPSLSRK